MKKMILIILAILFITPAFAEYGHKIEMEEKKCIQETNALYYESCAQKAELAWENEIQRNLKKLKRVMTESDFKYINEMNNSWNKTIQLETRAINQFIYNKDGIANQTIGRSSISDLKKEYATLLNFIYYNYTID